jgi:hypothetical protein
MVTVLAATVAAAFEDLAVHEVWLQRSVAGRAMHRTEES